MKYEEKGDDSQKFNQQEYTWEGRNRIFFMSTILKKLSTGTFFKRAFSIVLKILGVILALAGIVGWVTIWGVISEGSFGVILVGLIAQLLLLIILYMFVHVIFIRANEIKFLPVTGYSVIPISSIFLKMMGELYATISVSLSLLAGLLIWLDLNFLYYVDFLRFFIGGGLISNLFSFYTGNFLGGIITMLSGLITSFFVLLFFYFLSEAIRVSVDIAQNTKYTFEAMKAQRHKKTENKDHVEDTEDNDNLDDQDNLFK